MVGTSFIMNTTLMFTFILFYCAARHDQVSKLTNELVIIIIPPTEVEAVLVVVVTV